MKSFLLGALQAFIINLNSESKLNKISCNEFDSL